MAVQLQDADYRLIDYRWYVNESAGPVFWASVNRFCADCAETTCPVFAAIQRAKRLPAKMRALQTVCPFVAEYREADGEVARRRRAGIVRRASLRRRVA